MALRTQSFRFRIALVPTLILFFACGKKEDGGRCAPPFCQDVSSDGGGVDTGIPIFESDPSRPDAGPRDSAEPEAEATCTMETFSAPSERCRSETLECLERAFDQATWDACFEVDPECGTCLDEAYDHCTIGSPAEPGRCAEAYGCWSGCVDAECGENSTQACIDGAAAGDCKLQSEEFDRCWNFEAPENDACSRTAWATCEPPSVCGNGVREFGESCDGDCPTSCAPSTDPCETIEIVGSSDACDVECVTHSIPNCGGCPLNPVPSSALGFSVFSGSFFDRQNWFSGGCVYGQDAVYAWRAPATGVYDFLLISFGEFAYFGDRIERTINEGTISVMSGHVCASATIIDCSDRLRLTLSAGDDVLVVGSRSLDTDSSDGVYDLTAPYDISIQLCTPSCAGKQCGDDGCGGSCGACGSDERCTFGGTCECVPQCAGNTCGDDGCGGSCGYCPFTHSCVLGSCVCTPDCQGRSCGDNGCGGTCGTCSSGSSCSGGTCIVDPDSCDPVTNTGCAAPNECILYGQEQTACALAGSGTQGDSCATTSDCSGGYACFANDCRKICDLASGAGCSIGETCNGVSGWAQYGACAP